MSKPSSKIPKRTGSHTNSSDVSLQRALLETPAGFAWKMSRGRWIPVPHLLHLSQLLTDQAARRTRRMIVMMPPRHGKSQLVSEYGPPWYLRLFPDHRVMLASYEASFAESWGRKARDVVEQHEADLGFRLRDDSSAASRWDIAGRMGGMHTAGVGGPITGKGANWLIIDDPVKNDQEANSQTMREHQWQWLQSTAMSRLEPDGVVTLIMTRWHQDDLAGRLLNAMRDGGEHWTVVSLPAVAEHDEAYPCFRRQQGDALWPARYPADVLEAIKVRSGPYWWAALYQQRPQPAGGGTFKREWFRYFREHATHYELITPTGAGLVETCDCWRFATVDLAASTKTTADYFVIGVWAVTPQTDMLLLDVIRARLEGPDQLPLLRQTFEQYNLATIAIERTGYQLTMVQAAIRAGLPAEKLEADTDKVSRALTAAARMAAGKIYFRAGAHWLHTVEGELLSFPTGAKDDIVDVTSYAAIKVAQGGAGPRARRL